MSITVIKRLLRDNGFKRRNLQKTQTMKEVENRNEQFENITEIKEEYMDSENPVISMDTKKKELLGTFYRKGTLYTKQGLRVYDHDFSSFANGIVIPHGIYDLKKNTGYINIGTSKETSEFACDSILNWWVKEGKESYPNATSILILCDGGGSNSSRHYIFKKDLIKLVDKMGIEIRIAHYPPYTSKYNPIEHRLFPHVTRACQGVIFENINIVKELMKTTSTKTGLSVTVNVIDKIYDTNREVSGDFKKSIRSNPQFKFHKSLPNLNYSVLPSKQKVI